MVVGQIGQKKFALTVQFPVEVGLPSVLSPDLVRILLPSMEGKSAAEREFGCQERLNVILIHVLVSLYLVK